MDNASIVRLVDAALKKHTPNDLGSQIIIDADRISLRDGRWRVVVYPVPEPQKVYYFYEVLANVEEELQSNNLKISLYPSSEPASV